MSRSAQTFRRHARISELCPVFDATLHLLHEEGTPLHQVHERPVQVVANPNGSLCPRVDRRVGVILGVGRRSALLPHMEADLQKCPAPPWESLFLELPLGDRTLRPRIRLAQEASDLLTGLAEAGQVVKIVAISHRRAIHGSVVLRHYPAALFDLSGTLLWTHPAAPAYGLIRHGFPAAQKMRALGPLRRRLHPQDLRRRLDDATGLPSWYRFAFERLREEHPTEKVGFADVIHHQAELWVAHGLAKSLEGAMQEAGQDYLRAFEIFFGMGGLRPMPSLLSFA